MNIVDHVVLAAPDLEEAKAAFEEETGVMPIDGGPHEGLGTRNALVSFGEGAYLEIIAPDPAQSLEGTRGERFAGMPESRLFHWAVRVKDLNRVAESARAAGFSPRDVIQMARLQPNGTRLEWELMGISVPELGGCAPFFIDWLNSPHPSSSAPYVGTLTRLQIELPADSGLNRFLDPRPRGVTLVEGNVSMTVAFESPKGPVTWTAQNPDGFGF